MGLINFQGQSNIPSSRDLPKDLRPELLDKRPVLDNQAILDEQVVKKSFINNSSILTDGFNNELSSIAGYPEGSPILVTYYSQNRAITDVKSHNVDIVTNEKDVVHVSWSEIRNFEMRIPKGFDFDFDAESAVSKVGGTALVYAGFEPQINDLFIYEMGDADIGVFRISEIQRTAIRRDTYHEITFTLQQYLDVDFKEILHKQTTQVFYFDKQKFLTGNHAFLTSLDYTCQQDLSAIRKEIIQNYADRFYKKDLKSFMRPDRRYDPYIVEFWNRRISYRDCYFRPTQLLPNVTNFYRTIWSALTTNPIKNTRYYKENTAWQKSFATFWSVSVTPIIDMEFITVGNEKGGNVYSVYRSGYHFGHGTINALTYLPLSHEECLYNLIHQSQKDWLKFHAEDKPHPKCPLGYSMCKQVFDFHDCKGCKYLNECLRWHCVKSDFNCDPCDRPDHHLPHEKEVNNYYALSEEFYLGSENMPPFERLVYDCLRGNEINPEKILEAISTYISWDDMTAFYYQLFSLYLIGRALYWLQNHS